jgi:hypothetical protein
MSLRLAALVAGAVLAAVALGLVGVAVLDVADASRGDHRAAASPVVESQPERHARPVGVRVGEAILGVADERAYLDALRIAKAAAAPGQPEPRVIELRAEAMVILAGLVRGDGDRALRARAANLLGVLFFEDAKLQQNPRRSLENALFAFQDAVRLDPSDVRAKANLELLATIPAGTKLRQPQAPGAEASASPAAPTGY